VVFKALTEPFIYDYLATTPVQATALGYHEHVRIVEGKKSGEATQLDPLLDDFSPAGVQRRIQLLTDFQTNLHAKIDRDQKLSGDEFADYAVVDNFVSRELYEIQELQPHVRNPILYVQLLGQSLYMPIVHEYASQPERYRHIIARLQKIPAFLDQAKQNLQSSPAIWTQTARTENDGIINLIRETLAADVPAELKGDFDSASQTALAALRDFNTFLDTDLAKRSDANWRLGAELYGRKLKLWTGGADKTPDQLLSEAEKEFENAYQQLIDNARPVHREIYGGQRPPSDRALITDVLDVVTDENRLSSGAGLLDQIRKDIESAKNFVQAQELAPLPPGNNLQVIPTPGFLRSSNPVAHFIGAPPLQPTLAALYMVTPIPSDWPRARELSKLREYNLLTLKLLTIEYAIPGYYAAREFANTATPEYRRLLHALGNPSFLPGWAFYITDSAVNAGLEGGNQMRVIFAKEKMRILSDAILDIRMHTQNMSEEDAMTWLRERAFQEVEGARDRILRVQLTSAQLPLPFYGWREWLRVRDHYQNETQDFSLRSFHEKALRAGSMAFPDLGYITADHRIMK
jgi:uncharacterized protein (DUF885 family)